MTRRRLRAVAAALVALAFTLPLAAAPAPAAGGCAQVRGCAYLPLILQPGTPAPRFVFKFVANAVQLPQSRTDFAIDLNGDGRVDDQFGSLVGALTSQGLDLQGVEDQAIQSGSVIRLLSVETQDQSLTNDSAAGTTVLAGRPQVPDYSGAGTFSVDTSLPPAQFGGQLVSGAFRSPNPATTVAPVDLMLKLAFLSSATPITLPLHGAHVQFQAVAGPPARLINGQIHGSIKNSDVQTVVIPAIAAALTQIVQADPSSSQSQQIKAIFDTGNCTNPNGTVAQANDGRIDTCEVATNSLIRSLLAPDVQIYDAQGYYAPNPANTTKDSLSFGLGFSAVPATY